MSESLANVEKLNGRIVLSKMLTENGTSIPARLSETVHSYYGETFTLNPGTYLIIINGGQYADTAFIRFGLTDLTHSVDIINAQQNNTRLRQSLVDIVEISEPSTFQLYSNNAFVSAAYLTTVNVLQF